MLWHDQQDRVSWQVIISLMLKHMALRGCGLRSDLIRLPLFWLMQWHEVDLERLFSLEIHIPPASMPSVAPPPLTKHWLWNSGKDSLGLGALYSPWLSYCLQKLYLAVGSFATSTLKCKEKQGCLLAGGQKELVGHPVLLQASF